MTLKKQDLYYYFWDRDYIGNAPQGESWNDRERYLPKCKQEKSKISLEKSRFSSHEIGVYIRISIRLLAQIL